MKFERLFDIIGDNKQLSSLINNLSKEAFEVPFLMQKTLEMLSDESPYVNIITDGNKKALANMLMSYFNSCWNLYVDDYKLDNRLKFGKLEIYKIEAPKGLRYATAKEVSQGVKGLIAEYMYPAGEDNYKKLSLLNWTFNGINFYYREAGFKLTYQNSKEPKETLYEMIVNSAEALVDLFKWCSTSDNIDKAIKIIDKIKKNNGFKYASYESDEIEESISIKQLVYNIDKVFPRNSDNIEYRRAIALVIKAKRNIKTLTPIEISFLREIYDKKALERDNKQDLTVNIQLKNDCENLLKEQYSGKIKSDHFAYKIITTLKNKNYTNCSSKQYNIIRDALAIIEKYDENKKITSNNEKAAQIILDDNAIDNILTGSDEDALASISDALGSGFFDEED